MDVTFTPERDEAIRAGLVKMVAETQLDPRSKQRPLVFGLGILLGAAVASGGITAAAATGSLGWPFVTDDPLPGGQTSALASGAFTNEGVGDARLELPAKPAGSTHLTVAFTCLTAGDFTWGTDPFNNPGTSCAPGDVGTVRAVASYDFPIFSYSDTFYVTSPAGGRWSVEFHYLTKKETEWSVNQRGETYGVIKPDGSTPDLVAFAVPVTGGNPQGYVRAEDLNLPLPLTPEDAANWDEQLRKTYPEGIEVPVWASDGTTRVGTYVIPVD